ncbi:hypothetical protein [Bacillus sp. JJ722]|uniref:hypothetical protein n=1 Tax=Bacillus sp. JJ722 TaxID=3122973 RepID=UPI002FFD92D2
MNALEAADKVDFLNKQIEALTIASERLYDDFDTRIHSTRLEPLILELKGERDRLSERLRGLLI